jgi:hypothetical protein
MDIDGRSDVEGADAGEGAADAAAPVPVAYLPFDEADIFKIRPLLMFGRSAGQALAGAATLIDAAKQLLVMSIDDYQHFIAAYIRERPRVHAVRAPLPHGQLAEKVAVSSAVVTVHNTRNFIARFRSADDTFMFISTLSLPEVQKALAQERAEEANRIRVARAAAAAARDADGALSGAAAADISSDTSDSERELKTQPQSTQQRKRAAAESVAQALKKHRRKLDSDDDQDDERDSHYRAAPQKQSSGGSDADPHASAVEHEESDGDLD